MRDLLGARLEELWPQPLQVAQLQVLLQEALLHVDLALVERGVPPAEDLARAALAARALLPHLALPAPTPGDPGAALPPPPTDPLLTAAAGRLEKCQ